MPESEVLAAPSGQSTAWARFCKRMEVPIESDAGYTNTRWANRDLIPTPPNRRTYHIWSFAVYWLVSGACISAYSTGSSLLAYGLTPQEAMACVVTGGIFTGLLSVASGWMGEVHHISFTVASRYTWGMRGSYFPVVVRTFTSLFWFGIQAYWGGQATRICIGAIIPGFAHMKNTLPASAHISTKDLIGLFIWYALYIPLVMVPPEKLQRPFIISSFAFVCTMIGLVAWSVSTNGGGGPLFYTKNTSNSRPWSIVFGISAVMSSWGGGTTGQSDWTRYSSRRYAPTLSQLVAAPLTITLTALLGIVITSASSNILGAIYWSPITLLVAIQDHYGSSSGVRAAVFFGGLGCAFSQLAVNVVLNAVSHGMDMAGLAPRYINIRRGAYIIGAIALASNPWQILTSAGKFLTVISGFGIFTSPLAGAFLSHSHPCKELKLTALANCLGMMIADYLVVRKRVLKIEDLYVGDTRSAYWFAYGFNWRAIICWCLSIVPTMPGFIILMHEPKNLGAWALMFKIAFPLGVATGFTVFTILCLISPPPQLHEGLTYLDDAKFFPEGGFHWNDPYLAVGGSTVHASNEDSESIEKGDAKV